jgi:hypothetical protein
LAPAHFRSKINFKEKQMKFAAKKKKAKAAAAAAGEGTRGRKPAFVGMKLFKTEPTENSPHKLRESSRRKTTYDTIKNGMKFETFAENGGHLGDLSILVKDGHIEARAE